MLTSRVRVAVGAGLLSTGLLIASTGGAVALADPDSSVSPAHAPQGGSESSQGSSPAASVTDTLRKAVSDMAGALTAGRTPGQPPSTSPTTGTSHARTSGQRNATPPTAAATPIPNAAASAPAGCPGSEPGCRGSERGRSDLPHPGHLPGQPERDGHRRGRGGSHRRRAGIRRHQRCAGSLDHGGRFGRRRHVAPAEPPGSDGRRQPESSRCRGARHRRRASVSGG